MKRIMRKNQVIITVLAVMIAIAGYLTYAGRVEVADSRDISMENTSDAKEAIAEYDTIDTAKEDATDAALTDIESLDQDIDDPGKMVLANGLTVSDYMAQDIDEVISQVLEIDENAVFLGDGVPVFMDKLKQYDTFTLAPVSANMQRSACVGDIALEMTDKAVDCNKFEIMYLRKSQAERELEQKNGTSTIK